MPDPVNRRPLLRIVTRNCARPYYVLNATAVDTDGKRWLRGQMVRPGPTIQLAGQPDVQLVRIVAPDGPEVRFRLEPEAEARARMEARWAADRGDQQP